MENVTAQKLFFQHLKHRIPPHLSLVDEISSALNISEDSAYRRIRGDKQLVVEEIVTLCRHYHISVDKILGLPGEKIFFAGRYIRAGLFDFGDYQHDMLQQFKALGQAPDKKIVYLSKDIPVYHYFLYPQIAAFKYFSWMKTLLHFPELAESKYAFDAVSPDMLRTGEKIAELYYQVPSTEILNPDNILTTLRQIEYYKDAKLFADENDLVKLYDSLEAMVEHMKNMASRGRKFLPGKDASVSPGEYKLYVNDFYVGDNTILATAGGAMRCFIVHSGANYLVTADQRFCEYQSSFIRNIIGNSTFISEVGEKERNMFFRLLHERIINFRTNKVQTLGNL